jgi:guanosine-3',5'-bis(diphosphate) 3'-pyrophosphohydrolase
MSFSFLSRVLQFAAHKHRNQFRTYSDGTDIPYFNHPIDVMGILANEAHIEDVDILAVALLHDTIEDTETTAEELREAFGDDITAMVLELTDDKSLPKEMRKRLQIEKAPYASPRAKLVKLADKIANLREINDGRIPTTWSQERTDKYYEWSAEVVKGLRGTHKRLEELFDVAYAGRSKKDKVNS